MRIDIVKQMVSFGPDFKYEPPATANAIRSLEATIGRSLPADYRLFLSISNGGEGPVGANGYLAMWKIEAIIENCARTFEIRKELRDFTAIGSNSGGEAFVFHLLPDQVVFGYVPFIGFDKDDFILIADSFSLSIEKIAVGRVF